MFYDEIFSKLNIQNSDFIFPRITILGKCGVIIEGHRGIMLFSDEEIKLRIKGGYISVTGELLSLSEVSESEAVVSGRIKGVAYA